MAVKMPSRDASTSSVVLAAMADFAAAVSMSPLARRIPSVKGSAVAVKTAPQTMASFRERPTMKRVERKAPSQGPMALTTATRMFRTIVRKNTEMSSSPRPA